jgi:hypothetical protein
MTRDAGYVRQVGDIEYANVHSIADLPTVARLTRHLRFQI